MLLPEQIGLTAIGLGLLISLWGQIKFWALRAAGLLVQRVRLQDDAARAITLYCWRSMRRSPVGERLYGAFHEYVRPVRRYLMIGYEGIGHDPVLFWVGWRPVLAGFYPGDSSKPHMVQGIDLTFLRGTINPDALLIEAMKAFNHEMHVGSNRTRFHVRRWSGCGGRFPNTQVGRGHGGVEQADPSKSLSESPTPEKRILGWAREEVGADHGSGDPWKGLSFPREVKELIEEGKRWLASEEWYKARRIPWRRGWLLYGKPGTGKTAFVRAMAQDLNLPLVVFDLASFGNGEFIEKWHRLLEMAPCVALIEDIDCVFKGRDNRLGEDGGGLSFDCLLNCLSGVESADGILTVVTTNRVEDLDEALGTPGEGGISTRPGRIDRAVEMLPLDEQCRRKVARNIVGDSAMAEPLVYQGEGLTGAQFQDLCAKAALAIYWRAEKCNGRQPQEVADASGSRQ